MTRQVFITLIRPGVDNFWYRGLLVPVYKDSDHVNIEVSILTPTMVDATKVIESKQTVSHYVDSIWYQGTDKEYYAAFANAVQAEFQDAVDEA